MPLLPGLESAMNPSCLYSRQRVLLALILAQPSATTMSMKRAALIFVALTLISSGCSELQPPAADRAAWLGQQLKEHPDPGWDVGFIGPVPIFMPTKTARPAN